MDELRSITFDDIAETAAAFRADRANVVAKNAVTAQGVRSVARVPEAMAANAIDAFDLEVLVQALFNQFDRADQLAHAL